MDYENTKIKGIHISRYMASWIKEGGGTFGPKFRKWLESIRFDAGTENESCLTKSEVDRICSFAKSGKAELESDAFRFIESVKF